jgi:hypothetical protein
MVRDSLNRRKRERLWVLLAFPLALGTAGLETGLAANADPDPVMQAGAATQAATPSAKRTTSKKAAAAATGVVTPKTPPIQGRRDPFKLPGPPSATAEGETPLGPLPPGTRGLVISRLRLEGIVRLDTTNTMIAVVDTSANRAYFLRENDAVYNGVVSKITPDSVTFRENALDQSGKVYSRDVVLRLTQGPGA